VSASTFGPDFHQHHQQNRSIFLTNLKTPVNRERNQKRSVHTHPQNDDRSLRMWITTTLRTQMQVGVRLQRNEDQTSHASIALLASKYLFGPHR
jgi:outer membrane usher protein FimD/PapC